MTKTEVVNEMKILVTLNNTTDVKKVTTASGDYLVSKLYPL